jgi:RNA polymerase sigma factor (sigma-70 family)
MNKTNIPYKGVYPTRNVAKLEDYDGDGGDFAQKLEDEIDQELFYESLTTRQKEIVYMLEDGLKQKEIAEKLGVSQPAVADIVKRVKKMLPF